MKIISTIHNLENVNKILDKIDGIIAGNNSFSTNLTKSFSLQEINELISSCHQKNKYFFLNVNQMMTDQQIDEVPNILAKLDVGNIYAFIVSDLGVRQALIDINDQFKVIYNPSTLLTNSFDFNYLKDDFYAGFIAKEITLADIDEIGNKRRLKTCYIGFGYLDMFYSKRALISNYSQYINKELNISNNYNFRIIEEKRPEESYPILEDKAGTHVFRPKVFSSLKHLDELKKNIDYLIIDSIFLSDDFSIKIINKIDDNDDNLEDISQEYNINFDEGFLNTKTFYKR